MQHYKILLQHGRFARLDNGQKIARNIEEPKEWEK
jgi:hypothetical protein